MMLKKCQPSQPSNPPDSTAESNVLDALRARGYDHTYQQRQASNSDKKFCYRTDIAIMRPLFGLRIDVEIDGDFKNGDGEIQRKLENRNNWFLSYGWHVIRFYASDCYRDADMVADDIIQYSERMIQEHAVALENTFGMEWKKVANQALHLTPHPQRVRRG